MVNASTVIELLHWTCAEIFSAASERKDSVSIFHKNLLRSCMEQNMWYDYFIKKQKQKCGMTDKYILSGFESQRSHLLDMHAILMRLLKLVMIGRYFDALSSHLPVAIFAVSRDSLSLYMNISWAAY
ncbi:hypothetical protein L1049_023959 [Liquidambar formosana]|uniref:Uncharacterized protein n=1 Tax=Liquidambar formosana TaxID=63359 RepID=A0AAP0WZ53_LIQFO